MDHEQRQTPTRDRIVEAANRLFYREGIRAVSVDAVAEEAGLTKRSLYYHFQSKDELVAAYLTHRDQPNLARYRRWFEQAEGAIDARIARIFLKLAEAAARPEWKGCGFLRTSAELANMPGHPALKIGAAHKKRIEAWFAEKLKEAGIADPESLARQIATLLDGSFATAMLHRDPSYFGVAGEAARALVASAPRKSLPDAAN